MKKSIFFIIAILIAYFAAAQNAPNFNSNDCDGSNYDLHAQLDAGNVIVVCWVMPCSTCIPGAKTSYNVVQSFQSTHPGKVFYYLCDDLGDTPCSSINSWANSNSIPASASSLRFSNAAINMTNYGSTGMPKITVFGGSSHTIYYNVNGTVNGTALQAAITTALNENGIEESGVLTSDVNVYPNPAKNSFQLAFILQKQSSVIVEMYDILGKKVFINKDKYSKGINKIEINTLKINNGIYFIKISDVNGSKTLKINVSH